MSKDKTEYQPVPESTVAAVIAKDSRKPKAPEGFVDIKEATELLGFKHTQYTRRLLAEGDPETGTGLWGKKVQYKGFSKWWIDLKSIEAYQETHRREMMGRRFVLNTALENEERIRAALDALDIEFKLELSYKSKTA